MSKHTFRAFTPDYRFHLGSFIGNPRGTRAVVAWAVTKVAELNNPITVEGPESFPTRTFLPARYWAEGAPYSLAKRHSDVRR